MLQGTGATDKARQALKCNKCDASEGIYYGDVRICLERSSLARLAALGRRWTEPAVPALRR